MQLLSLFYSDLLIGIFSVALILTSQNSFISVNVPGQVGWDFEQIGLVKGIPVHDRGMGFRWSSRSLPMQTFCDSVLQCDSYRHNSQKIIILGLTHSTGQQALAVIKQFVLSCKYLVGRGRTCHCFPTETTDLRTCQTYPVCSSCCIIIVCLTELHPH